MDQYHQIIVPAVRSWVFHVINRVGSPLATLDQLPLEEGLSCTVIIASKRDQSYAQYLIESRDDMGPVTFIILHPDLVLVDVGLTEEVIMGGLLQDSISTPEYLTHYGIEGLKELHPVIQHACDRMGLTYLPTDEVLWDLPYLHPEVLEEGEVAFLPIDPYIGEKLLQVLDLSEALLVIIAMKGPNPLNDGSTTYSTIQKQVLSKETPLMTRLYCLTRELSFKSYNKMNLSTEAQQYLRWIKQLAMMGYDVNSQPNYDTIITRLRESGDIFITPHDVELIIDDAKSTLINVDYVIVLDGQTPTSNYITW